MKRGVALGLVCVLSLEWSGCATLNAPLMDSCRGSDGRFASCPSGGSAEGALIGLGVAAGIGLIAGIVYLATRGDSSASVTETHACIDGFGQSVTLSKSQSCERAGYRDAPASAGRAGAEASNERAAALSGGRRVLRCYDRAGLVVASTAASCGAAGLASAPGAAPAVPVAAVPAAPPGPTRLHCFDAQGEPVVTDYASCAAGGYFDTIGAAAAALPPAEPAEAAAERHAAVAHTCVGRTGTMLDLAIDQPCPRGYIERDAPRRRRHHGHR